MSSYAMTDFVTRGDYRDDRVEMKADFRLALHEAMAPIVIELRGLKEQVTRQNGRVTKLERLAWGVGVCASLAMWAKGVGLW